jgi:transposase-like protein
MAALAEMSVPTLDALAETANREHQLVLQAGEAMVGHAIGAGEALLAAREEIVDGDWQPWIEENFVGCLSTAHNYMRVAIHKDAVQGLPSMRQALTSITGQAGLVKGRRPIYPAEIVEEAKALHEEGAGINEIAREFGASNDTVLKWVDPEYRERRKRAQRESAKRTREEKNRERAKREQTRLRKVAREKGGGIAEAYSLACRMEDQIGRAEREASNREAKAALAAAGAHFRNMRDEIVRALGVS